MTKLDILSICLLAALLPPLAGCVTPPRHDEVQVREHEVQTRDREALARDREMQVRDREAQARERKAQVRGREEQVRDRHNEVGVVFSEGDIAYIRDYYKSGHPFGNTAGRIMKLRRGELYPFGYTWRPLPRDLENRLSRLPDGYIRIIVGTDIGIINTPTRVVADLTENLSD